MDGKDVSVGQVCVVKVLRSSKSNSWYGVLGATTQRASINEHCRRWAAQAPQAGVLSSHCGRGVDCISSGGGSY